MLQQTGVRSSSGFGNHMVVRSAGHEESQGMTTTNTETIFIHPRSRGVVAEPVVLPAGQVALDGPVSVTSPDHQAEQTSASDLSVVVREHLGAALASAVLLGLWELAPRLGWIDSQFFPPPSKILAAAAVLVGSGELFLHIGASLARALIGFSVAITIAIPTGVVLAGRYPRATQVLSGLLSLLGQINAFTLFPLFVLFFGIGEAAKFGIIFWSCLWPVLGCTILGVRKIDPTIIKGARALGCDQATLFRAVLLPAALPAIFSGARVGAGVAFLMLAAAEMIGAQAGLGWLVQNASMNYNIPRLYVAAVAIALMGISIDKSLHSYERHVIRWLPDVAL
jgi:NitT/TauT family transport system permease protein